jgi:hypothetical protein
MMSGMGGPPPFIEDMPPVRRLVARIGSNARWIREYGWSAVAEEHEWHPIARGRRALARAAWRRAHPRPTGGARPVLLVGAQRSGTNMIVRGFAEAPSVEVHGENDRQAFERYKLRDLDTIRGIVQRSRADHVLFKPLCDSHRTPELLDALADQDPRAIWAYRDVEGRVQSAVAKFGDGNRRVLEEFCAGRAADRWQVQRISERSADFVRSMDPARLSAESGAALFWLLRNRLYLELGLSAREDTMLVSYNRFLADPEHTTRALCSFLGTPYAPSLHDHVAPRPPALQRGLDIDPRVLAACHELQDELDALSSEAVAQWS